MGMRIFECPVCGVQWKASREPNGSGTSEVVEIRCPLHDGSLDREPQDIHGSDDEVDARNGD